MVVRSTCVVGVTGAAILAMAASVGVVAPGDASGADQGPAATKNQRQYRCTKCRQVYTYDRPGNYKCPTCNKPLIPVR